MTETDDRVAAAQAAFDAGQFLRSRGLAVEGLLADPDDTRLLRLAGRSSLELGLDDAGRHLKAVAQLRPQDPDAWRDVGLAAVEDGDLESVTQAFHKVLELAPDDAVALVHLAHASNALGQTGQALELLTRAAGAENASPEVLRTLIALATSAGDAPAALQAAVRLLDRDPKDVGAALARADLHLALGDLDDAIAAFSALRSVDDDDGHESYAIHGQVEALLRAERWRAALDVAIEATRVDRLQLTTDLLRFASAKLFGEADRSAPPWDEIQAALAEERAAHRRLHAEQEML